MELHLEVLERYKRSPQPAFTQPMAPPVPQAAYAPPQALPPEPLPPPMPVTPTLQRENITTTTLPGSSTGPLASRPMAPPAPVYAPPPAPYQAAPPAPLQQPVPRSAPDSSYVPPALPELERELPSMLSPTPLPTPMRPAPPPTMAAPVYAPAPPQYMAPPPAALPPAPPVAHPAYPEAATGSWAPPVTDTSLSHGRRSYLPPSRYEQSRQLSSSRFDSPPSQPFAKPAKKIDPGFTVEVIQPEPRHIPPSPPKKKQKAEAKKEAPVKEAAAPEPTDTPPASEIEKSVATALKEDAKPTMPSAAAKKADDLFADLPPTPADTAASKEAPALPDPAPAKTPAKEKEKETAPVPAAAPSIPELPGLPAPDAAADIPPMPEIATPKTVTVPKEKAKAPAPAPSTPADVDLSFLEAPDLPPVPAKTANDTAGKLTLSLPFSATGTAVASTMESSLSTLAAELKETSSRITIVAFASGGEDASGGARRTSLSRAIAVRNYLKGQGISEDRMATKAQGNQGGANQPDRVDIMVQ